MTLASFLPHASFTHRPCSCRGGHRAKFDKEIRGIRAAARDASTMTARKLIDELDSATDVDLSELRINSRRSLVSTVGSTPGCYGPYGAYGCYPPSYPSPFPPPPFPPSEINTTCSCTIPFEPEPQPAWLMCKAGTDFNDCCQTIDRDWECTYEPYPSPPSNIGREVNTTCSCIAPPRTEPQPAWLMCKPGTDFNDCCQTIDRDWDCTDLRVQDSNPVPLSCPRSLATHHLQILQLLI